MILVKVFEGVHPDAPVEASTLPTRSGLIRSRQMFNLPGGIDESMFGCHIKVTAYAFLQERRDVSHYGGAKG